MGLILKRVGLESLKEKDKVYSKLIRGNLPFTVEAHQLNKGTNLVIELYRDHPRVKEFIEKALEKNILTCQEWADETYDGVLRLKINDDDFMINNTGIASVEVTEYNLSSKEFKFTDFPQGKVYIKINITLDKETDNSKIKTELKKQYEEE